MNPMNPHSTRIQWIEFKSGFLGFMIRAFLGERIRKKEHVASGLRAKTAA